MLHFHFLREKVHGINPIRLFMGRGMTHPPIYTHPVIKYETQPLHRKTENPKSHGNEIERGGEGGPSNLAHFITPPLIYSSKQWNPLRLPLWDPSPEIILTK